MYYIVKTMSSELGPAGGREARIAAVSRLFLSILFAQQANATWCSWLKAEWHPPSQVVMKMLYSQRRLLWTNGVQLRTVQCISKQIEKMFPL